MREKGKVKSMATIDWQKKIKKLSDQIQVLENRTEANSKERERLIARQNEAEEKLKSFNEGIEEARKDRQKLLVLGKNINELNERMKRFRDEKEIRSDEIIGIQDRLGIISQESSKMYVEIKEARREILYLKAIPVRERYNQLAELMAPVVSEIWKCIRELGEEPGPSPNNRVFSASTWGGALICIPRIYDPARFSGKTPLDIEIEKKDFFKKK
jgi:archaellum component FlaC